MNSTANGTTVFIPRRADNCSSYLCLGYLPDWGYSDSEDSAIVRALGLAHYWSQLLDAGKVKTPADIARLEAMNVVQVPEILRLTLLAPDVIEAIVDARAPRRLTLEFLLRRSVPRDWEEQRALRWEYPNHIEARYVRLSGRQVSAGIASERLIA